MKVVAFDFYDKKRESAAVLKLSKKVVKKNNIFKQDDVSYRITKVFSKKDIDSKCIEIRMVAYKIANTITKFAHKCPAKKGQMEKMQQEVHEVLSGKYGKKTVGAWKKGKVKMKMAHLSSICPDCACVFWKEKDEKPKAFDIVSLKGKKKLIKRK